MVTYMAEEKEKIYVAFDPGVTTGWATFFEDGRLREFGQVLFSELMDLCHTLIEHYEVIHVIYEDYRIFAHKAHAHVGSRVPTVQAVGVIKASFMAKQIPITMQPSNILPIAEKWTQTKIPSDHSKSHQVSAFLHGSYYLIKNGLKLSELQLKMKEQQDTTEPPAPFQIP